MLSASRADLYRATGPRHRVASRVRARKRDGEERSDIPLSQSGPVACTREYASTDWPSERDDSSRLDSTEYGSRGHALHLCVVGGYDRGDDRALFHLERPRAFL